MSKRLKYFAFAYESWHRKWLFPNVANGEDPQCTLPNHGGPELTFLITYPSPVYHKHPWLRKWHITNRLTIPPGFSNLAGLEDNPHHGKSWLSCGFGDSGKLRPSIPRHLLWQLTGLYTHGLVIDAYNAGDSQFVKHALSDSTIDKINSSASAPGVQQTPRFCQRLLSPGFSHSDFYFVTLA